jgi:hypothetical protein
MPIPGFDDWDDCVSSMMDEQGYDEKTAEAVCGSLEQEAKAEHGDARQLLESIREAGGMILDAAIDLNSAVEVPAIDSRWVAMKSADSEQGNTRIESQLVLKQDRDDEEKRISYAPAMIPREIDKEGDLVPTPVVEQAAHDYLKNDGGVDTDHNLIEGKGEVVESWIEPDERTWDLPDGGTETYPAGTWMLGIEWQAEPWERIKEGELTGLSIYGSAEQVTLKGVEECNCPKHGDSYKDGDTDSPNNGTMPDEPDTETEDEAKEGPSIETLAESINEMQDTLQTVTDELKSETEEDEEKQEDAKEAAAVLADEYGVETGAVLDALDALANEEDEDEDEEDMEESKEKDETAKHKGHDGEGVREAETAEKQSGGSSDRTSFAHLAKETAEGR